MKEVDLGNYRKARIWVDDLPLLGLQGVPREICVLPATKESIPPRHAAVEVFVPLGGRFQYGLLGGQLVPLETDQLSLVIAVGDTRTEVFEDSLLSPSLDVCYLGLPLECVQAIRDGVCLAKQRMRRIVAGEFVINRCAHSNIGSSPNTFKLLALILTSLIHSMPANPTNQDIVCLFDDASAAIEGKPGRGDHA